MAPFNLSDLAVKELKIPVTQLSPETSKSFVGKVLAAHVIDFWATFWATVFASAMLKASIQLHVTTGGFDEALGNVSFSAFNVFTWVAISFTYFFVSYFLNHGQTPGMKIMKCRVKMNHHNFRNAFQWAFKSLGIYVTMGLTSKAFSANVGAHDYLWHDLIAQKEVAAPDVRTLKPEIADEELWKIAA